MPVDLFKQRRKAREKRQRERDRAANEAALTPAQRAARERRREKAAQAAQARQAAAATEQAAARAAREAERAARDAAAAAAERERKAIAVTKLRKLGGEKEAPAPAPAARSASRLPTSTPTLRLLEAQSGGRVEAAALPSRAAVERAATSHIFAADRACGVCVWDEGAAQWARPDGWRPTLDALYAAYGGAAQDGAAQDGAVDVVAGEYNAVFRPTLGDTLQLLPPELLELLGVAPGALEGVVVRVTRPDSGKHSDGRLHYRFKPLAAMVRELYFTLHAAANGVAPRCRAALLFPAIAHRGAQLYGALYIFDRAERDAHALLEEHFKRLAKHRGSAQYAPAARDAGAQVARRVAHMLYRQSALGALNADVKLNNIVFEEGGVARAIDFDGSMYSLMREGDGWAAHLLANLALITAHVRAFCDELLADGWARETRSLLIELLTEAKRLGAGGEWVFKARARPRTFVELSGDSPEDAVTRLEFITHSYFGDATGQRTRFELRQGPLAPPLIEQLVCFGAFGHTRGEPAISAALNAATATPRIAGWPQPPEA